MAGDSTKHILQSLAVNLVIAVGKGIAAVLTGSGAMLAETLHSASDCVNQLLLLLGVNATGNAAEEGTYAPWTSTMVRKRWEATLKAAKKLPPEIRDELHVHDMRHCFASFLLSTGEVSIFTVSKLMGHTTSYCTARYGHLHPKARQEAMDAMNKAFANPAKAKKTTAKKSS